MDNFIVSARKYRPDSFETVVGQDAITQTLKNSIKINQLAQAYLFCGPRGVGKTTCARIFAKTINCTNLSSDFEACNECESCVAFNKFRSLNIHELDAASNNSVDDIRNLIDQVRIPPQIGKYSVYIIDEVHMLTNHAFNAFLKTLEEPPKHVIFIMATTEKHKIIPTILSRCQIFDFNRISVEDIRARLEYVAQRENIEAEHDALHIIAQKADGAMRDALSIFDQIVSFAGKKISYEETIKNLNILDYETYFRLTRQFIEGNYVEVLKEFDLVLKKGFEAGYFISGIASHFRDLLVCKDPGTINLLEVGKKAKQDYLENSQICSVQFLFKAIKIANDCDLNYKTSLNKRLLVEIALLQICNIQNQQNVSQVNIQNATTSSKNETPKITELREPQANTYQPQQQKVEQVVKQDENLNPKTIVKDDENKLSERKAEETKVQSQTNPSSNSFIGVSISSLLSNNLEKAETEKNEITKNNDENIGISNFSEDNLKEKWDAYVESLKQDERVYSFLKNSCLSKDQDFNYYLNVDSESLKKTLDLNLNNTMQYMRKNLDNRDFFLEYRLSPQTHIINEFKSDEDKLEDMMKENPRIKTLKDQLNLDFE